MFFPSLRLGGYHLNHPLVNVLNFFPSTFRHSHPTKPQVRIILPFLFVPCSLSLSFSFLTKNKCQMNVKHCSKCWGFNHEQDNLSIFSNRTYNSDSNNTCKCCYINVHTAQKTRIDFKWACHFSKLTSNCFISLVLFLSALGHLFITYHHTSDPSLHLPPFTIIRGPSSPSH